MPCPGPGQDGGYCYLPDPKPVILYGSGRLRAATITQPVSPYILNPISTRTWRLAALGYLGVVVYLTLLPFDFSVSISLSDAWARYQNIRFDGSGPRARQQWASNLLMFVPLGFFWAAWWLHRVRNPWLHVVGALPVMLFCLAVTSTVEFFQMWIPNRGSSLTDISANATGGVVGVLAWLVSRIPAVRGSARGLLHRRSGLGAWVAVYVAAYVFISLLPFDLIVSARELSAKLASGQWGWIAAADGCWWGVRCVAMRGLEVLLVAPVGLWVAYRLSGGSTRRLFAALGAGAALGLLVEAGQLLTVSGITEGASVVLRALGAVLGASVWVLKDRIPWRGIHTNLRPLLLAVLPIYLLVVVLLAVSGVRGIDDWEAAVAQWESMRWLPFYYHYFVPESAAIQSVLMHLGMYAFLGLGLWLWDLRAHGGPRVRRGLQAAGGAALLAVILEASKLFMAGLRPDTAAPILAGLAAGTLYAGLWWWVVPGADNRSVPDASREPATRGAWPAG